MYFHPNNTPIILSNRIHSSLFCFTRMGVLVSLAYSLLSILVHPFTTTHLQVFYRRRSVRRNDEEEEYSFDNVHLHTALRIGDPKSKLLSDNHLTLPTR